MTEQAGSSALTLSPELEEFRPVVRRFFERHFAGAARSMLDGSGYDLRLWQRLASELELPGIAMPARFGGADLGLPGLVLVQHEAGRVLAGTPFLATSVLAAGMIEGSGDAETAQRWLPGIAAGSVTATLALFEEANDQAEHGITLRASRAHSGYRLTGVKTRVLDGEHADLVLMVARTEAGASLFAVGREAPGLHAEPLELLDPTRPLARLVCQDVPATLVGGDGAAWPVVEAALRTVSVAVAAEALGGAERCLEMATGYASQRYQFGRPVGSFQAVKHRLADMAVQVERARSGVHHALGDSQAAADAGAAALAHASCVESFRATAQSAMQVHGGVAMTWEHPSHLFFRRAHATARLWGTPERHRELFLRASGI